ncbi:MAG: hypothetical protein QOD63_1565, partial [Actinomycetota bacterium]|nr:hypothetical protein [Actinomycetota bacterium]
KIVQGKDFKPGAGHVVALIVGLLGFVAILASADVLARAIAAGAQGRSDAMAQLRDTENLIPFSTPLRATLQRNGTDPEVTVLAATGGSCAYYLIKNDDDSLVWTPAEKVRVLGA